MANLRKIHRGEILDGLPSETWNGFIEAAERAPLAFQGINRPGAIPGEKSLAVEVRNTTSGDITARFPILKLTDPAVSISDDANAYNMPLLLDGAEPDATDNEFAIIDGPMSVNLTGSGVISGITWCKVDVQTKGDKQAGPISGDSTKLKSGYGPARIL